MPDEPHLLLGADIGTGGVRAVAVTGSGQVVAESSVPLRGAVAVGQPGWHEQAPQAWWEALCTATATIVARLPAAGWAPRQLAAMAVDGTSGTLVSLDAAAAPLRPAMMYNDPRGEEQAARLNRTAGASCRRLGYRFKSSFALAKILWLQQHEPECFDRTAVFLHQADYLVTRLTDGPPQTDYSNALKTGYDLLEECWPAWIQRLPGVAERLPAVVAPGSIVGRVTPRAAASSGLPAGLPVVAGATDGTTACLASGVRRPGDYSTTLGTTLVFKCLSREIGCHPQGLIYSHKLPGGLWLPGAASNTGGEWIGAWFPDSEPRRMDTVALAHLPSQRLAYPLVGRGERFPFLSPEARGFLPDRGLQAAQSYAACLQGVAFLERLAYDVLDRATSASGGDVYSTGGGSRSEIWLQCRADATGRTIHRPACAESAFGAAVLAASATCHDGLGEAIAAMVRIERTWFPNPDHAAAYQDLYRGFLGHLSQRGYL